MSRAKKRDSEEKAPPSSVLDEQTGGIIYRVFSSNFGILKEPAEKRLEEMMKTPLTDLSVINERLDSIGDLVKDDALRKGFGKVVNVFSPFLLSSIYDNLRELLASTPYSASHAADRVKQSIRTVAEEAKDFPSSLGGGIYTKTICGLVSDFNSLMSGSSGSKLADFFRYMSELDTKLGELEDAFSKEERRKEEKADKLRAERNEKAKANPDILVKILSDLLKGISSMPEDLRQESPPVLKWLKEIVDFERLTSFIKDLEATKPLYSNVYPYFKLAEEAVSGKYVRPEVVQKEENCLVITKGYWSVPEKDAVSKLTNRRTETVPNNTQLNAAIRVEVLEGVNDGGKTFDLCKSLYVAARALAGSWVPAEYARVSIRDHIIMRMKGTGNTISALQKDCKSTNEVMPPQNEYWLIGMDETFRSTEAHGGEALTAGIINSIGAQGKSLMIVSSHYLDLHNAYTLNGSVRFMHFPFMVEADAKGSGSLKVTFPHVKLEGSQDDHSYAIAVARVHGFNETVLKYAEERIKSRQNPAETAKQ